MYRILRDNKERGPISLDELLALQLKPFDLIWVEGKSAGWRYPSEINTLQPYLNSDDVKSPESAQSISNKINPPSHPASQNIRSFATNQKISASPIDPGVDEIQPDDELTADKLEKKAAEIYQRVQAYNQQKVQSQQNTQTKYARSLEDLKQEYADWMHKKKEKKNFRLIQVGKPVWIGAGIACLVIFIATLYYNGNEKVQSESGLKPGEHYISNAATPSSEIKNSLNQSVPEQNITSPQVTSLENNKKNTSSSLSNVDQFIDSVRKAMARGSSSKPFKQQRLPEYDTEMEPQTSSAPVKSEIESDIDIDKKQSNSGQQVNMNARYQQEANKKSISSLEVTIHNNGAELIKNVSVDVFYYKKGDRLFDKETIYFSNIQPGNSLTVSRPGNRKAVTARFQLGQVNSLQN